MPFILDHLAAITYLSFLLQFLEYPNPFSYRISLSYYLHLFLLFEANSSSEVVFGEQVGLL